MNIVRRSIWPQVRQHEWKFTRRQRPIAGIIWHATRGNQGYTGKKELSAFVNWAISPNNRNTRSGSPAAGISNYGIGPWEIVEVIPDEYEARFSSWPADTIALSVEVAQSNKGQVIEPETIAACVQFAREKAAQYGFPLTRVFPASDRTWTGMTGHEDTLQGKAQGKSDPGPEFWGPFMAALNQEEPLTPQELERIEDLELALAAGGEERGADGQPLPRGDRLMKARLRIVDTATGNAQSYGDRATSAVVLSKRALAAVAALSAAAGVFGASAGGLIP